ncbi:MAG: cobalamin B12-binding domain-containing protein [Dehalococcoidia bacterium]|nr:cobalamin B12-binding domain-containing protein [Dehalococcoidia bacterium]
MGIAYIAGLLEHKGYEVQVIDLLPTRASPETIKCKLDEYQPDIVGITSVTLNYPAASAILRYCKQLNQDLITVIGGPHVTLSAEATLREAPWIDVVVRGEGEMTMLDIASGKALARIPGLAYRENGNVRQTADRPLMPDLDNLPLPARHLFPLARYLALESACGVIAGRGCPFNCIFCVGSRMGGRKVRFREPRLVVDEIEKCLAYGFEEIHVQNDLFTLNHRHLNAFCAEILSRGLEFRWSAFARVDTVNREVLRRMREAGCTGLCFGIESGVQEVLDRIKKKITLEQVRNAVRMANDMGFNVQAAFILGLPGESRETLARTREFAQELGVFYGLHVLAPFPASEVREKASEFGIEILTDDWTKYDANTPVTRTRGAAPEDIISELHRYYIGLRLTQDDLAGLRSDRAAIEKDKRRAPLAWALLKNDVIENTGPVPAISDPLSDLSTRLAAILPYPPKQIENTVLRWWDQGLLESSFNDGCFTWSWK